jgi:hypothetical protein
MLCVLAEGGVRSRPAACPALQRLMPGGPRSRREGWHGAPALQHLGLRRRTLCRIEDYLGFVGKAESVERIVAASIDAIAGWTGHKHGWGLSGV